MEQLEEKVHELIRAKEAVEGAREAAKTEDSDGDLAVAGVLSVFHHRLEETNKVLEGLDVAVHRAVGRVELVGDVQQELVDGSIGGLVELGVGMLTKDDELLKHILCIFSEVLFEDG